MNSFFEKNKKYIEGRSLVVNVLLLCVTIWIGSEANAIANKQNQFAEQQNIISTTQTEILKQQTEILNQQTDIQSNSLEFEKDKNRTDTEKMYREKMSILFDKITSDPTTKAVHEKIKKGEIVSSESNLDNYVNGYEDIGILFCNGNVKLSDLRGILRELLRPACGNAQIFNHYGNTKSGFAGMCKKLFPGSSVMATYANSTKCPVLKK